LEGGKIMAGSVNSCTFIGRAGKDPELKYTQGGSAVANFSLAVDESWKDQNGEKQQKTEWVNVVCWAKLAEIVGEYVKKGKQLYVQGKLQTRSYEKNGETKYITEIRASQVVLLGSNGNCTSTPKAEEADPYDALPS
jgi:single-strand DNA-binding protein